MRASLAVLRVLLLAVVVGAALAIVTKVIFELFLWIIDLLWDWLPARVGVDPADLWYLVVVLGTGGLLVGLGNRFLGYEPRPLEEIAEELKQGEGIDYRRVPRSLANSVASLGFGGPLGPQAAVVSVVGGLYFWIRDRMEAVARNTFAIITGRDVTGAGKPWRYAPTVVMAATVVAVFRELPGGIDLSFVPIPENPAGLTAVATATIAGLLGGMLGKFSSSMHARVRNQGWFRRSPELVGIAGGLVVALLASGSFLVPFSGAEQVGALFDGSIDAAEMTYAGVAKWLGLLVVLATGWKGGPIFPLMFVAGALAMAAGDAFGFDGVIIYAGGIAGVVTGVLRSIALGVIIALLVVPPALLAPLLVGGAAAGLVLRDRTRSDDSGVQATPSPGR